MTEYRFLTCWQFEAPLQPVFDAVADSLRWPDWWQGVQYVEQLEQGDASGVDSLRRYTWRSLLLYRLRFDARATRIDPPHILEATVDGDLRGFGRWTFGHEKGVTVVNYEWNVHTTRNWMNLLAPIARKVFAYNHHALMQRGAEGLARHLRARLICVSYLEFPNGLDMDATTKHQRRFDWRTAALAGLLAGVVATAAQLMLWWATSDSAVGLLLRDTRLAAAIVMGPGVLPPPATFAWTVMLAAALLHGALSVCYGLLLAPITARLPLRPALLAGAAFGVLLYGVNMYGFTALFPWFAASRDWITVVAHIAFGLSAACFYKLRNN